MGPFWARDSSGLRAQMSMGLEIALALKDWQSILGLGLICVTDVKDIDIRFSWIADGIFVKTLCSCEAKRKVVFPNQKRAIEHKVINIHRQEKAKSVALMAKYPNQYGKK
jgi:hypothetical protein